MARFVVREAGAEQQEAAIRHQRHQRRQHQLGKGHQAAAGHELGREGRFDQQHQRQQARRRAGGAAQPDQPRERQRHQRIDHDEHIAGDGVPVDLRPGGRRDGDMAPRGAAADRHADLLVRAEHDAVALAGPVEGDGVADLQAQGRERRVPLDAGDLRVMAARVVRFDAQGAGNARLEHLLPVGDGGGANGGAYQQDCPEEQFPQAFRGAWG
jgi:hypothetical protein